MDDRDNKMKDKDNKRDDKDKKCWNKNININAPIVVTQIKKKKKKEDDNNSSGGTTQAVIQGLSGLTRSVNETIRSIAETDD